MAKKAFVRYDGNKKIVPGSLIVQDKVPKVGTWREVPVTDLCCNSGVTVTLPVDSFPIALPYIEFYCVVNPTLIAGAIDGTYTNATELAAALNAQMSYMGVFSVNDNGDIVLDVAIDIVNVLTLNPTCSGNFVGYIIPYP